MFNLLSRAAAGRLLQAAADEATLLTERHDVPHTVNGVAVPDDLNDVAPRWWQTRDGHRIAGRLLPNDLAGGAPSPASPLIIGLLPLVAMASLLLSQIPHIGGAFFGLGMLLLMTLTAALWAAEGATTAIGTLLLGALLPLIAAGASVGGPAASSGVLAPIAGAVGLVRSPAMLLAPLAAVLALALVFAGSFSRAVLLARALVVGAVGVGLLGIVAGILRGAIGPMAGVLPWFAVGAALPWLWAMYEQRSWAMRLAAQDTQASGETSLGGLSSHREARIQQAEAAIRDTSPLVTIGTSVGLCSGRGDNLAPDARRPLCMSVRDLSEHFLATGSTGSGKTTSLLRQIIVQWLRAQAGGLLVLDEKDLPGELRKLKRYHLIEPGVRLGLLEGLTPSEVVNAVFSVGEGDKAQGGNGASAFFATAARTMFLQACIVTDALIAVERAQLGERGLTDGDLEAARTIRWTVASIRETLSLLFEEQTRGAVIAHIDGYQPDGEGERYMLDAARDFWSTEVPTMDPEVRSNMRSTLVQKIDPLTSHPALVAFAHCEKSQDFNIDDIRWGGRFGVGLPKSIYGTGGTLIGSLVKERVASIVRRRASYDWAAAGELPILAVFDEAAGVVDAADAAMLKVARSLGMYYVIGVQNLDAFVSKLGSEALAQSFFDNFRSFVSLNSTPYTLDAMSKRLGTTRQIKWAGQSQAVNFSRSLELLAHSALVDPTHPAHPHLRQMVRSGAGLFKEAGDRLGKGTDRDLLKIAPIETARVEALPLFGPADFGDLAGKKFRAIATVQRAGVPRRDLVDLVPLFTFPADVFDLDPANASTASTVAELPRQHLPEDGSGRRRQVSKVAQLVCAPILPDPASEQVKVPTGLDVQTKSPSHSLKA